MEASRPQISRSRTQLVDAETRSGHAEAPALAAAASLPADAVASSSGRTVSTFRDAGMATMAARPVALDSSVVVSDAAQLAKQASRLATIRRADEMMRKVEAASMEVEARFLEERRASDRIRTGSDDTRLLPLGERRELIDELLAVKTVPTLTSMQAPRALDALVASVLGDTPQIVHGLIDALCKVGGAARVNREDVHLSLRALVPVAGDHASVEARVARVGDARLGSHCLSLELPRRMASPGARLELRQKLLAVLRWMGDARGLQVTVSDEQPMPLPDDGLILPYTPGPSHGVEQYGDTAQPMLSASAAVAADATDAQLRPFAHGSTDLPSAAVSAALLDVLADRSSGEAASALPVLAHRAVGDAHSPSSAKHSSSSLAGGDDDDNNNNNNNDDGSSGPEQYHRNISTASSATSEAPALPNTANQGSSSSGAGERSPPSRQDSGSLSISSTAPGDQDIETSFPHPAVGINEAGNDDAALLADAQASSSSIGRLSTPRMPSSSSSTTASADATTRVSGLFSESSAHIAACLRPSSDAAALEAARAPLSTSAAQAAVPSLRPLSSAVQAGGAASTSAVATASRLVLAQPSSSAQAAVRTALADAGVREATLQLIARLGVHHGEEEAKEGGAAAARAPDVARSVVERSAARLGLSPTDVCTAVTGALTLQGATVSSSSSASVPTSTLRSALQAASRWSRLPDTCDVALVQLQRSATELADALADEQEEDDDLLG